MLSYFTLRHRRSTNTLSIQHLGGREQAVEAAEDRRVPRTAFEVEP